MRVHQVNPKTLDEAVHAAVSMEAWQSKEKQRSELQDVHQHRNHQNGTKMQQSSDNGIQLMLREILKTLQNNTQANNGQNSPYSKQQAYNQQRQRESITCFSCGEEGHISRNCSNRKVDEQPRSQSFKLRRAVHSTQGMAEIRWAKSDSRELLQRDNSGRHSEDNHQESMDNIECFEASNPATVGVYSRPEILTTSIVGVSIDGQDTDNQLPGFVCGNSPDVYPHSRSKENIHSEDNHKESIDNTQCFEASNPATGGVYSRPEILTTSIVGVSIDGQDTDNQLPGFGCGNSPDVYPHSRSRENRHLEDNRQESMDNIECFEASNPATVGVYSRPEILTTSIIGVSIDCQDNDNQLPGFGCGNSPDVYPHSRSKENRHLEDNRQESMDNIECFEASNPATVGVYSCPEILTTSIVGVSIDGQDNDNQLPGFGCGNSPDVYPHSRSKENRHLEDNRQESMDNIECFEASNSATVGVYSRPEILTTSIVGASIDGQDTDNQLPGFVCGNSPDVYPHSRSRENKHLEDNRQESMDNIGVLKLLIQRLLGSTLVLKS